MGTLSKISKKILEEQYETAEQLILDALKRNPNSIELSLKLIIIWKQKGEYHRSINELSRLAGVIQQYPKEEIEKFINVILYYIDVISKIISAPIHTEHPFELLFGQKIVDYYFSLPYREIPKDLIEPLKFVMSNWFLICMFIPCQSIIESVLKPGEEVPIQYEEDKQLYFIWQDNKKLYYPENTKDLKNKYYLVNIEQHQDSPHRYLTDTFNVSEGDIILDVGAAEANFALDSIEYCKKAYIFEPDVNWHKALNATFETWAHKVILIDKFVSNSSNANTVTIDEITKGESVNFIKLDVEGFELQALQGAVNTINNSDNLRIAVCTYHNAEDVSILSKYLTEQGFEVEYSNGYMLFPDKTDLAKNKPPFFRKGLIRATKRRK